MIGVLVSGRGSNLQALIDQGLPLAAVASNVAGAGALARAEEARIPIAVFALEDYGSREERDLAMAEWFGGHAVELVVCAGYMHLLTPAFLRRYTAINVHPSLLPDFPGTTPIEDALAAGVPETGVTVHFVDEGVDSGAVIVQEPVPVRLGTPPRRCGSGCTGSSTACSPRRFAFTWQALYAPESRMQVGRALISVFDKTGLDVFARGLADLGVEICASGGTAAYIADLGIDVVPVEELTDVPELLGGRVKTLHPSIHAGILARRGLEADLDELREHGIRTFDLVCVNLYPFRSVTSRRNVREEDAVEMIDIGGPALLRAAAKNFVDVVPVCETSRYEEILAELGAGGVHLDTRRKLAAEAFAHTAAYETSIAAWFADIETFPPRLLLSLEREQELAYGENPHQRAAYYAEAGARRHLLSRVDKLGGKELSFNNLNDLDAARAVLREFTLPACVIVKHASPCGVAVAATIEEAYEKALASDPVSAYGGIVALNRKVSPRARRAPLRAVHRGADRAGVRRRRRRDAQRQGGPAHPARP